LTDIFNLSQLTGLIHNWITTKTDWGVKY